MADLVFPGESAGGPINADAMPSNWDIDIYEGDTFEFTMTVKDSGGVVINLTGYTAKAQLKTSYSDGSPITFATTITTPSTGVVSVSLSAAQTAALIPGTTYIYDVQLTDPSGKIRTFLTGDANVFPEVTT